MHKSRALKAFERRLYELGCPAGYAQRSVAELGEHFEDSAQAYIADGLESSAVDARVSQRIGEPEILAEQLVASYRVASWWGRHPIIGFCLLPPVTLMILLPATVLVLYGLFLLGNLFSRHAIPLDEFKRAVITAPSAFVEWNNPLLYFIHSVPIAITTILFCKLVARSASGMNWFLITCGVCSLSGFFTWTGFSPNGFYLGYGSPATHNWISAAIPWLIAAGVFGWRTHRLRVIGGLESGDAEGLSHADGACQVAEISNHKVRRPRILLKEEWFTPTSAVAAALVVVSFLVIKFVFFHDRADYAKLRKLRQNIWPAERKATLDFLRSRQSLNENFNGRTISLQPFATAALTDPVYWFGKTNFATLSDLPRGLHTFAGIPFAIGDRLQLMGNGYKTFGMAFPSLIKGIPIYQKCRSLYILHGASFVRTPVPSIPDEHGLVPVLPSYETTNQPIARLVLRYEDGTDAKIEIFATQHLLDVWGPICRSEVPVRERSLSSPDSELAWADSCLPAEKSELLNSVRLYKSRFENPRSDLEILTLDYVSTRTEAAPFLLGLTIE
jgi:hypothetical protein